MTIELSIYLGYSRDAASVNANLQVRKLREELAESQEKYAEMEKVKGCICACMSTSVYIYAYKVLTGLSLTSDHDQSVNRTFAHMHIHGCLWDSELGPKILISFSKQTKGDAQLLPF